MLISIKKMRYVLICQEILAPLYLCCAIVHMKNQLLLILGQSCNIWSFSTSRVELPAIGFAPFQISDINLTFQLLKGRTSCNSLLVEIFYINLTKTWEKTQRICMCKTIDELRSNTYIYGQRFDFVIRNKNDHHYFAKQWLRSELSNIYLQIWSPRLFPPTFLQNSGRQKLYFVALDEGCWFTRGWELSPFLCFLLT